MNLDQKRTLSMKCAQFFSPRALMSSRSLAASLRVIPSSAVLAACLMGAMAIFWATLARADDIRIDLQSGADTGGFVITVPTFAETYQYTLPVPVDIYSGAGPAVYLGTLLDLNLTLDNDPGVTLDFHVIAGAATTHFTVSSGLLAFSTLTNVQGFASAAITVTDNDSDGAIATGSFAGGTKAFEANYNGSSNFADLVSTVSAGADDSGIGSERFPLAGTSFVGTVSSIQTQFDFLLSANDSASGTSRFNVTGTANLPEPSSFALACAGAVALLWRARRRSR